MTDRLPVAITTNCAEYVAAESVTIDHRLVAESKFIDVTVTPKSMSRRKSKRSATYSR